MGHFGQKETYPGVAQTFWYSLLSQERVWLRTSNSAGIHSQGPYEQKVIKNLGQAAEGSVGVSRGCRKFVSRPTRYYLRNGKSYRPTNF